MPRVPRDRPAGRRSLLGAARLQFLSRSVQVVEQQCEFLRSTLTAVQIGSVQRPAACVLLGEAPGQYLFQDLPVRAAVQPLEDLQFDLR